MNRTSFYSLLLLLACLVISCQTGSSLNSNHAEPDSVFIKRIIESSPPLDANEALRAMVIEDGFEVKLVAAEPLLNSPIAMNFDDKGRIWVVEMQNFMPNANGEGEDMPTGKIVILEDENHDGVSDTRKVFLDSLVLPRAFCFIDNGILVAEPPYLWYFDIENDKPVNKVLVDSAYAEGNNVEHQPNGLLRALDNWVYSSDSEKRYRKKGNQWLTEKTHLRGQWGITQDDYGRLFYNNNSQNLIGDYFSPGLGSANTNQHKVLGYNQNIVEDNRVYPIRPTTGVNRGYQEGILTKDLRLKNFTAASGPVIYRGNLFGEDFYQNAFVGEPSANLIKRNILFQDGNKIKGNQAYDAKEFLASYDERFRPVTLYNGPDGALYVVDMYRGVLQHKLYITEYLKTEINKRSLEQPINYGRIYKVVPKGKNPKLPVFPRDPVELVKLLDSKSGWMRDKAQQTIIDNKLKSTVASLRQNLKQTNKPLTVVHSLWTLEGLDSLKAEDVLSLLKVSDRQINEQALTAMGAVLDKENYQEFVDILKQKVSEPDSLIAPYIAFQANVINHFDKQGANEILMKLAGTFPNDRYVVDAIISSLKDKESVFYKNVLNINADTGLQVNKRLKNVLADIEKNKNNKDLNPLLNKYPRGASLFKNTCQTCHGVDGNGIELLAPPLNNSNWVKGDKEKLIAIVLYGLSGPLKVNNKLYDKINGEMPGIGNNKDLVDEDIAQLLSFIRKNWSNNESEISRMDVIKIRNKFKDRQNAFTMAELDQW